MPNTHPGGRLRWHIAAVAAVTGAAALLGASGATARADAQTIEEIAYITTLDSYAIPYRDEDAALNTGYAICNAFRAGMSLESVVSLGVRATRGAYTATDVAHISGAAIGALCPDADPTSPPMEVASWP